MGYVFLGAHNTVNKNRFVLFPLSSRDARVSSCFGCDRSLKMIMVEWSNRIPDPPFDLFLIIKMCREYRKDGKWENYLSSEIYISMHKWKKLFGFICIRQKVNLNEILNALHVGFLTFTLNLVNSIKEVNWNTSVKIPYLTIRSKFDRQKSLYEIFFLYWSL